MFLFPNKGNCEKLICFIKCSYCCWKFHHHSIIIEFYYFRMKKGANAMMNVKWLPVIHSNSIKYSCKWDDEIRFYFEHLIRIICLLNHLVGILNELTWTAVIVWWLVTKFADKESFDVHYANDKFTNMQKIMVCRTLKFYGLGSFGNRKNRIEKIHIQNCVVEFASRFSLCPILVIIIIIKLALKLFRWTQCRMHNLVYM